jgi:NSS family neurotransmitter:Na+ symporter
MIFPLVLYSGTQMAGPELLFQAVPSLVKQLPGGHWFGVGFFLCLYLAALGASIGLLETVVANLRELRRIPRPVGTVLAVALCLVAAIGPALSSNILKDVRIGHRGLLALLDAGLINWLLPIAALVSSQAVAWLVKDKLMTAEFEMEDSKTSRKLYSHWIFVLRYVSVPVIVIALLLQLFSVL